MKQIDLDHPVVSLVCDQDIMIQELNGRDRDVLLVRTVIRHTALAILPHDHAHLIDYNDPVVRRQRCSCTGNDGQAACRPLSPIRCNDVASNRAYVIRSVAPDYLAAQRIDLDHPVVDWSIIKTFPGELNRPAI